VCSKLNRHVQMMVSETGMSNFDEEFRVMYKEAGTIDEVKHIGRSGE